MRLFFVILLPVLGACAGVQSRYHKIKLGEDWNALAQKYRVSVKVLKDSNENMGDWRVGRKVHIPFEEREDWNTQEVTREIARSVQEKEAVAVEPIHDSSPLVRYIWPVSGRLSSKFGRRRGSFHEGIDIAAPQGMNVRASRSGHVIYSNNRISGYGNLIIIRHADGYSTVYAHLSKRLVKGGQFIAKGTVIGKVGMTGHASSPHLHFEVRKGQLPVNPLQFLASKLYAKVSR